MCSTNTTLNELKRRNVQKLLVYEHFLPVIAKITIVIRRLKG